MTKETPFQVNVANLLRIAHERPDGSTIVVVAYSCSYVSVRQDDGSYGIAVEIVFDPAIQPPNDLPQEPYYCSFDQLRRRQFPPRALSKIWPATEEDTSCLMS